MFRSELKTQTGGGIPARLGLLSANPVATLIRICKELGVKAPNVDDITPGVAKLADETSLDWMRRYGLDAAR